MARTVIENCAIATVDPQGSEYSSGQVVIDGPLLAEVGQGRTIVSGGWLGTADQTALVAALASSAQRIREDSP